MKRLLYYIHDRTLAATNPCMLNVEKISEKFDGSLSLRERINMFFHLKTCHCCTRYYRHLKQLQKLIKKRAEIINKSDQYYVTLSKESSSRMKERLLKEMQN